MTQYYAEGDFTFMSDVNFVSMLKHALHVVKGFPNGMKEMELDPGIDGYVVVTEFDSDIRKNIDNKLKTTELGVGILDDPDLYRRIMGIIQNIAYMGWDEYVERELWEERSYDREEMLIQEEILEEED